MGWFTRRPPVPDSVILPPTWRRYAFKASIAVILVAGLFCARSTMEPVAESDWTVYHDRSFRVARVVDGDTLDIEVPDKGKPVTRIRLCGVDTPETGHGKMPLMHFGPEATAFAKQTLEGRRVHVVLSPKKSRGKYGRLLAYVFLERGGRMFNEMLLREGFAYADLRFKHYYFDRFKSFEKLARKAGVGLWAKITLDEMPPWKQRFEKRSD